MPGWQMPWLSHEARKSVDEAERANEQLEVARIVASANIAAAAAAQRSAFWARVSALIAGVSMLVALAALYISISGGRP